MPAFSKNPTKSHILLILGVSLLSSRQVYAQAPSLAFGVRIDGERWLDPAEFVIQCS